MVLYFLIFYLFSLQIISMLNDIFMGLNKVYLNFISITFTNIETEEGIHINAYLHRIVCIF